MTFSDNGGGNEALWYRNLRIRRRVRRLVYPTNGVGSPVSEGFMLTVDQSPGSQGPPPLTDETFTVGTAGSLTTTFAGYPAPSITNSGTLPTGLSFQDDGSGSANISGTPAADTGGEYPVVLTATNSFGTTTQDDTIYVDQPSAITSSPSTTFTEGANSSFTVTTSGYPAQPTISCTGSPVVAHLHRQRQRHGQHLGNCARRIRWGLRPLDLRVKQCRIACLTDVRSVREGRDAASHDSATDNDASSNDHHPSA